MNFSPKTYVFETQILVGFERRSLLTFARQLAWFAADITTRANCRQPLIKASLRDLPALGRHPFEVLGPKTLFVWGRHDQVLTRPRHLRANDRLIRAGHSAPLLAPRAIAEVVLPFLR